MRLASIRLVTNDVDRLIAFYARLTGSEATRFSPEFGEFRYESFALAISSEALVSKFNAGAAVAAANRSAMVEFEVDDVDAVARRMADAEVAMPPTDMPWGNRSLLLRDPDGNVVNIFKRAQRAG